MKFKIFERLYEAYKIYKPKDVELSIDEDGVKMYVKGGEIGYVFINEPEKNDDFYVANFLAKIKTCIELIKGKYYTKKEFNEIINNRIDNYINTFNAYKELGKASLVREVLNG